MIVSLLLCSLKCVAWFISQRWPGENEMERKIYYFRFMTKWQWNVHMWSTFQVSNPTLISIVTHKSHIKLSFYCALLALSTGRGGYSPVSHSPKRYYFIDLVAFFYYFMLLNGWKVSTSFRFNLSLRIERANDALGMDVSHFSGVSLKSF